MKHPMRKLIETAGASPTISDERKDELAAQGFNVRLPLYHGTDEEFETFDASKLRTAKHFYLTPDPRTAAFYGENIYVCFGRTAPLADLTGGESIESHRLLKRLADTFADEFEDEATDHLEDEGQRVTKKAVRQKARELFLDIVTGGDFRLYSSGLQDSIMLECFSWKFNCIRVFDDNSKGAPISYVFDKAENIAIVGVLNDPDAIPHRDVIDYL